MATRVWLAHGTSPVLDTQEENTKVFVPTHLQMGFGSQGVVHAIVQNTDSLFNLARTLTLTNVVVGSNVRLYTDDGDTSDGFGALIDNDASAATSTVTLDYTYTGAVVSAILVIIEPGYQYYRADGISLGSSNQSIPISQITDFAYSDPA